MIKSQDILDWFVRIEPAAAKSSGYLRTSTTDENVRHAGGSNSA